MNSMDPLHNTAAALIKAAQAFHSAAGQRGSHMAAPPSLARTEEALGLLSGAWYQLAADASPGIAMPGSDGLSHEQQVHFIATLHDVAAAFARCARTCRDARLVVTPVIARPANDEELEYDGRGPGSAGLGEREHLEPALNPRRLTS
jgi:hypothetical protein